MRDKTGIPPYSNKVVLSSISLRANDLGQRYQVINSSGTLIGQIAAESGALIVQAYSGVEMAIKVDGGGHITLYGPSIGLGFNDADGFLFNNDVDMGGFKISDLPTPATDSEAATKGYVDGKLDDNTLTDASGSRALATQYQNTHTSFLAVYVTITVAAASTPETLRAHMDSATHSPWGTTYQIILQGTQDLSSGFAAASVMLLVPKNWYYYIDTVGGGGSISEWWEQKLL